MPLLNIVCPICTEVFNNADDVYSTSCGHLFHFGCMNEWRARVTSCPQCRHYNPTTHKLYLSFDESDDLLSDMEAMKQKLQSSNEKIIELQVQNSETEVNFMKLQEQYTAADKAKRALEANIKEMNDSEEHFMQLQCQYTECTELVKDLEDRINQLSIENEFKTKELQLIRNENETLKAGQNISVLPDNILQQRIKILEQKLKNLSVEFEKEINTSTQLSIEKMKLESYIKNLNALNKIKQLTDQAPPTHKPKNPKEYHKHQKENKKPPSLLNQNESDSRNDCIIIKKDLPPTVLNQNQSGPRNRCIIIKNLPKHLIDWRLELIVIHLASNVNMSISANDLEKVEFLDKNHANLFAEFKNCGLKEKFLAKKCLLNKNPLMKSMIIREYMDENIYELYKCAKDKLKGERCVFCANNKIYAKSYKDQRNIMEIKSIDDVYNLQQKNTNKSATIDENYYEIGLS